MKVTILVGPPGSGKSTLAAKICFETQAHYINQDSQGKAHLKIFEDLMNLKPAQSVVVDRMNFNVQQRARYLDIAKAAGYVTEIIVIHQPYQVCLDRALARQGHETIKDEKGARSALKTFFTKYERPTQTEADKVTFLYPEGPKPLAIYSDLDGTLCDVEHRRHHVRKPAGEKKDWKLFFDGIADDTVNEPVMETLWLFQERGYPIVYCSGRDDNYRKVTLEWLNKNGAPDGDLYMRNRHDQRQDYIIKEILLDFEVLTRYQILLALDDRDQVVKMLRSRGVTVFQVAEGDF